MESTFEGGGLATQKPSPQEPSAGESSVQASRVQGPLSSRFDALDALRGFAVLGIFIMTIAALGLPEIAYSNPFVAGGDGPINYGLWGTAEVLVHGSMRGLFSVMFGAGVVLFTAKAISPDGPIRIADLYYRRMMWLAVIGFAHAVVLLMPDDILLIYGLAGLILFPFRVLSPRKLLGIAVALLAVLVVQATTEEFDKIELSDQVVAIEARAEAGGVLSVEEEETLEQWEKVTAGYRPPQELLEIQIAERTGSPATVFIANAKTVARYLTTFDEMCWWIVDALTMMFLGMALYKWRIITAERSLRLYGTMAAIGYGIGITFRTGSVLSSFEAQFMLTHWAWTAFDQVSRVAMTLGHIGLFFVLWKAISTSLFMRALTATGRMALTNYISQSVIANLIFSGIGLGLFGSVERTGIYAIMVAFWVFQLAFSMWWLARFRFGPLEWGWRSLTYWQWQPLRN